MIKYLKALNYVLTAAFIVSLAISSTAVAAELRNLPANVKFIFKSAGAVTLETLSGKAVQCASITGVGEFTSERSGPAEYKFTSCKSGVITCTGLADSNGNITVKAEFHTRHLLPNSEGVNVAVLISSAHFTCSGVLIVDTGCQASADLLTVSGGETIVNKLRESVFSAFSQKNGDQNPIEIDTDNSLSMETCKLLTKEGTGANETSAMLGSGTINQFEVGGTKVTELVDLNGTL